MSVEMSSLWHEYLCKYPMCWKFIRSIENSCPRLTNHRRANNPKRWLDPPLVALPQSLLVCLTL